MSLITLPYPAGTFGSDVYLDATKLTANFQAFKDYLEGRNGGIETGQLATSARLQLAQLAEPKSVSVITFACFSPHVATYANRFRTFYVPDAFELVGIRVNVVRAAAGTASVNFSIQNVEGNSTGIQQFSYDSAVQAYSWGNLQFKPIPFSRDAKMSLLIGDADANVFMATIQLKLKLLHTRF